MRSKTVFARQCLLVFIFLYRFDLKCVSFLVTYISQTLSSIQKLENAIVLVIVLNIEKHGVFAT